VQLKGAEEIELHQVPDVCEAKHAYKTITEYNKAYKLKGAEGIALHKPDVCEVKHAYKHILDFYRTCKLEGSRGKGTAQAQCL